MNRLFTFLILGILLSQSAWAFFDPDRYDFQEQTYTQISDSYDGSNNYDHKTSDHCDHACAHLIGIISNSAISIRSSSKSKLITLTNIVSSIHQQPPVPPPAS